MDFHFYVPFVAAIIPLLIGFIWYNPKVFGNAWMKASDLTEEKMKGANMALIFGLTYVLSLFVAFGLISITIHQIHLFSIFADDPGAKDPNSEVGKLMAGIFEKYGSNFRTFKHGAFHGILASLMLALPLIGINALFERKGFKYIAINVGFWTVCLGIMGAIICGWM